MSPKRFEHLLRLAGPKIVKQDTKFRSSIKPEERLVKTLRFLTCSEDQQTLSFSFRISKSIVSMIIAETTEAVDSSLRYKYLNVSSLAKDFKRF